MAKSFYKDNLSCYQLNAITDMFPIECADGQELPYLGFVETHLSISCGLPEDQPLFCIFLWYQIPNTLNRYL